MYYTKNLEISIHNPRLSFKSQVTYYLAYITCAKIESKGVYVHNFDVNQKLHIFHIRNMYVTSEIYL